MKLKFKYLTIKIRWWLHEQICNLIYTDPDVLDRKLYNGRIAYLAAHVDAQTGWVDQFGFRYPGKFCIMPTCRLSRMSATPKGYLP